MTAWAALTQLEQEAWDEWMNAKSGVRMTFAHRQWQKLHDLLQAVDESDGAAEYEEFRNDAWSELKASAR